MVKAKWILVDDYSTDDNLVKIGKKWICSNCFYVIMRWSMFVNSVIRSNIPYSKPIEKHCPNCGKEIED